MKHLKLFFALFAMLALGVGNAWGAEETELFSQTYPGNPTKFTGAYNATFDITTDGYKLTYANINNGQQKDNWSAIRSGSKNNASVATITSGKVEETISKVMINFTQVASKSTNSLYLEVSNNSSFTSATKITATIATGNIEFTIATPLANQYYRITIDQAKGSANGFNRFDKIVFYQAVSSGGDEPETPVATLTANPNTIDFGTVYEGATVADKTVAVNFANLTGDVTYSGLSTPFTATGAISATGDKITISADASTIGEYTQTLTIASTADSKTAEVSVKINVVEKPAPTGTFTLHTGELIEGDYVIYYSGKAMKAEVASNRLQYVEVTPSNNEIVDPAAAAIWHIAKSGANWTVYNNNKGYAAGTGTKSQAGLVANLTGDNANKAAWTVTASGNAYEFVNVWNKSKSVNANLRNNTTYGFACYATGTGGALSLYRKAGTKYNVTVSSTTNGTVTADPTSAEAGTTITLTVTPAGGYVLDALTVTDASSNPVTVTDNKFTMPASDVTVTATFKENEKPDATLTLSKNGVPETFPGSWKQDDVVTLPSITSDCVKEFVGWSANPTCNVAPEYAAGDSYTLAATAQTLYAVYATAGAGETLTITPSAVSGSADPYTFTIDAAGYSLTAKKNGGSTAPTYNDGKADARVYAQGTVTLTAPKALSQVVFNLSTQGLARLAPITVSVGDIATQAIGDATVTWTGDATEVTFTVGDKADFGSDGSSKGGQLCFSTITVTTVGSYSNYSTTCAAALANPTFSLAEGKYTEAKSVVINYTEGTVYYTLDGTTPTASSTQYTGAIALNDCGEYTIKAIAISSDSQSDVVSATYTIRLPLTNSEAAPYTETEAVEVYNGGCYDNQDVYVKGTVKTATFYNSGTYTITLTNGFQFYKFYKSATKELFTDGAINAGDVLVACGKLSTHNTTYQLAEGCYLVSQEKYEGEKTDISNTEATAYTVDKAFELIGDVSSDLTKTVYVKGLVAVAPTSNPTADGQMTYKISDNGENTGNVLTVYLGLNLNGEKFTSKNDVQQGDYVVVKGKLLNYNNTYELNKGNQLVQHLKAATITIADITMEVGETKTIAATITPDAAKTKVTYSIKAGSDDCITLSENNITAKAEGTATIVATIATAEGEYMGKTVDFTVTVNAKSTKEKVVILAEYEGQWYAMKAQYVTGKTSHLAPLPVTYFDGKLYNVDEADKALIEWERAVVDGKATFYNYNDSKYLTGKSDKTDLTLATTACEWTISGDSYLIGSRTFLYNAENNWFRNFGTSNAGDKNYSDMPTVTAPVYATGDPVYTRSALTTNTYGTICIPYASNSYSGAEFYEISWMELEEDGTTPKCIWLDQVNGNLVAGKPYIFKSTSTVLTVNCTGIAVAKPEEGVAGLVGTFKDIKSDNTILEDNYMISGNKFLLCPAGCWLNAYRAYIDAEIIAGHTTKKAEIPGRRRVCLGETSENEATGVEDLFTTDAPVKVIENGQLIIIRDGVKYNVQGQVIK